MRIDGIDPADLTINDDGRARELQSEADDRLCDPQEPEIRRALADEMIRRWACWGAVSDLECSTGNISQEKLPEELDMSLGRADSACPCGTCA